MNYFIIINKNGINNNGKQKENSGISNDCLDYSTFLSNFNCNICMDMHSLCTKSIIIKVNLDSINFLKTNESNIEKKPLEHHQTLINDSELTESMLIKF